MSNNTQTTGKDSSNDKQRTRTNTQMNSRKQDTSLVSDVNQSSQNIVIDTSAIATTGDDGDNVENYTDVSDDDDGEDEDGEDDDGVDGGEDGDNGDDGDMKPSSKRDASNVANDSDDSLSIDNDEQMNGVMENDDDDDDEDPEMYFQKFDEEINSNYLLDQHPEQFAKNYDEIEALCNIVRDKNNNIIDALHKSIPHLTKYERTRILGQRAKQINSGSKSYIVVPDTVIDGYIIAQMELMQKKIPFIVQRPMGRGGGCEYWKLKDLEVLM